MSKSIDLESLSYSLPWKDFEEFSESIFQSFGYSTRRNFRLKKPRMEVDLLAERNRIAFAVDCKHWKRTVGHASMVSISEKQALRAKRIADDSAFEKVMPVVLTWRDESLFILENNVPIVPISRLSDFILNWDTSEWKILSFVRGCSGLKN